MKKIILASLVAFMATSCGLKSSGQKHQDSPTEPAPATDSSAFSHPAKLGGVAECPFQEKYVVIVAAYHNAKYADNKVKEYEGKGYTAGIIKFKNRLTAVGICPSDDLENTFYMMQELKHDGVCPEDGWILINE